MNTVISTNAAAKVDLGSDLEFALEEGMRRPVQWCRDNGSAR